MGTVLSPGGTISTADAVVSHEGARCGPEICVFTSKAGIYVRSLCPNAPIPRVLGTDFEKAVKA